MFVLLPLVGALSSCGKEEPSWPRIATEPEEFEVRIETPGDGSVIPIGVPFEVTVEVGNLSNAGMPTTVGVQIRMGSVTYDSAGLAPEADRPPSSDARSRFSGSLRLPETAPEGTYSIHAVVIATHLAQPQVGDQPPVLESQEFKAPAIKVTAKKMTE
ncbi:hypothetical protein TsocGM_06085 [Tautonia sociabilis]|uniref:Uncharacterized protein n=1 Tax=Tautonia sociabilis TaxID=2080755 RepID=A0A432MMN6_9BACT|nr:hypothetical protein TsocGM_06085 [Tautonia sociabilis]